VEAAGGYIQELQAAFLEGGPDAGQAATRRLQLVEQLCGAVRCVQFFQQFSPRGSISAPCPEHRIASAASSRCRIMFKRPLLNPQSLQSPG